jgi:hypothetical protein
MVIPYQIWMLGRLNEVIDRCATDGDAVDRLLDKFPRGGELRELDRLLAGCRVQKRGGLLFSA